MSSRLLVHLILLLALTTVLHSCSGESALRESEQSTSVGRVVVLGDSSCLDDVHGRLSCDWLLFKLLKYACDARIDGEFAQDGRKLVTAIQPNPESPLAQRRNSSMLHKHSHVIGRTPQCAEPVFSVGDKTINTADIVWKVWIDHKCRHVMMQRWIVTTGEFCVVCACSS
jgi:hypothetical protein